MTAVWTAIAEQAVGNQFTAEEMFNAIARDLSFLKDPPFDLYAPPTSDPNITTSSTSFVLVTGFSLSVEVQTGLLKVEWALRGNTTNTRFDIRVDSISITGDNDGLGAVTPASTFGMNCGHRYVAVTPGVHTVELYHRVTTGTNSIQPPGLCQFSAKEVGNVS